MIVKLKQKCWKCDTTLTDVTCCETKDSIRFTDRNPLQAQICEDGGVGEETWTHIFITAKCRKCGENNHILSVVVDSYNVDPFECELGEQDFN